MPKIDPRLLELLVCPLTKTALTYDEKNQELISKAAELAYPIRGGIPIMLADEARPLGNPATGPHLIQTHPSSAQKNG